MTDQLQPDFNDSDKEHDWMLAQDMMRLHDVPWDEAVRMVANARNPDRKATLTPAGIELLARLIAVMNEELSK